MKMITPSWHLRLNICCPAAMPSLVSHGANVNAAQFTTGYTTLHIPAIESPQNVPLVLASSPEVNKSAVDEEGKTALDRAMQYHPDKKELWELWQHRRIK